MGAAEVPQIPSGPEKRGLSERMQSARPPEADGNRATGTPWVASPFLRWGALGVAFISFSALLGYSALPDASDMEAAPALSFFAVYLTDAPLPADLEGVIVSIARVGAGDPTNARLLDLRVRSFDLAQHQGVGDALPVATGYVLAAERERVFIEFDGAVGLRGDEEIPLDVSERFLHVEYDGALRGTDRSAVLLDIDLERSVQEVDLGEERVLRFVPTVAEVYEEDLPASVTALASGEPMPSMEPLFATAVPMPPVKQYRSSSSPTLAPAVAGDAIMDRAPGGALDAEGDDRSPSSSSRSTSATRATTASTTMTSRPTTPTTTSSTSSSPTSPPVNHPPATPDSPTPSNGAQGVTERNLGWQGGEDSDGQTPTFEVFLSTTNPPPLMQPSCTTYDRSCTIASLSSSTTYYWRVRVSDGVGGVTLGDVWSFRTAANLCDPIGLHGACVAP